MVVADESLPDCWLARWLKAGCGQQGRPDVVAKYLGHAGTRQHLTGRHNKSSAALLQPK